MTHEKIMVRFCRENQAAVITSRDLIGASSLKWYPRLAGNQGHVARTPMDDHASIRLASAGRASEIAEVGTKMCARLRTN
jgi:hypothetical protein